MDASLMYRILLVRLLGLFETLRISFFRVSTLLSVAVFLIEESKIIGVFDLSWILLAKCFSTTDIDVLDALVKFDKRLVITFMRTFTSVIYNFSTIWSNVSV